MGSSAFWPASCANQRADAFGVRCCVAKSTWTNPDLTV